MALMGGSLRVIRDNVENWDTDCVYNITYTYTHETQTLVTYWQI